MRGPVSRILSGMTIPLGPRLPAGSCCLPGPRAKAALRRYRRTDQPARGPYSALLPVGLAVPVRLPVPRWALTPPFHPHPACWAVCSLWRFPWGCPRRALPGTVALWSPDFPPPPEGGGGHPAIRAELI